MEAHGATQEVSFPNTGYYLPCIYGLLGLKVETLEDMKHVFERCHENDEDHWGNIEWDVDTPPGTNITIYGFSADHPDSLATARQAIVDAGGTAGVTVIGTGQRKVFNAAPEVQVQVINVNVK